MFKIFNPFSDREYKYVFIVILALIAGFGIFIQIQLEKQTNNTRIVNIAGRQRMLSQALSKEVLLPKKNIQKIKGTFQELKLSQKILIHGDDEKKISKPFSISIQKKLKNLDAELEFINPDLNCILELCPNHEIKILAIVEALDRFKDEMNKVVFSIDNYSQESLSQLKKILLLAFISLILFIIISFYKVIYPINIFLKNKVSRYERSKKSSEIAEKMASFGHWDLDVATEESVWSDEVYRIYGLPIGENTNKIQGISFFAEHEQARIQKYVEDCVAKQIKFDGEFEFIDNDGNHKWVRSIGEPIVSGEGVTIKLVGVFQDVTQRKLAEKEIIDSKTYLELAMQGADLGIWDWNLITNEVRFDQRWCSMLGLDYKNVKMDFSTWNEAVHPDDLDPSFKLINDYIEGRTSNYENTHRLKHADGSWVYIMAKGKFSDWDKDGKPIRFTGTHLDITESKRASDEALKQKSFAEHNAKLASIGALAAGVGHEINNPLAIVKGFLEMLEYKSEINNGVDHTQFSESAHKMHTAIDRISSIVTGLRSFSRLSNDEFKAVNINNIILETVNLLKEIYTKEGIELEYKIHDTDKMIIEGNTGQIQQVIMNILSNAKDATKGVQNPLVSICVESLDNMIHIHIADNGEGIDPQNLERIFDPFFTTKDVGEGVGIGLSLVQTIIDDHGGSLVINSSKGVGSTFTIKLPMIVETSDHEKLSIDSSSDNKEYRIDDIRIDKSVLIVEDEDEIREILSSILKLLGMRVTTANNGLHALEIFKNNINQFDLIISDMKMPKMSGIDLLKNIKELRPTDAPLFIFMTGGVNIDSEVDANIYTKMADDLIYKPFKTNQIISKLMNLFELS